MISISIEQAIRDAVIIEQSAAHFYAELSGQAANEQTRAFFESLRNEELRHADAILEFGRRLTSARIPEESDCSWDAAKASPAWGHVEGINYEDALEVALESERGAALYYQVLASTTKSDSVRSFFLDLAETQQVHIRKLLDLMDAA